MGEPESYSMGLHLPGLLKILGEHLYSDPRVALREAIQNAHDSCTRRMVEGGQEGYQPEIVLRYLDGGVLELADNGSGLTREEIHDFLATIGRSYTGELRGELEWADQWASEELIGQFGLGLLSGFLIADQVQVVTRSYQPDAPTLCWTSEGGQHYSLDELEEERDVGSSLRLRLRPATRGFLDPEQLAHAVGEFVEFLPIPVMIEESGVCVSGAEAPWHTDAAPDAYETFVRERFGIEPLAVLPLHDHRVRVGKGSLTIPLRGCLFVPPTSVTSLQEFGDVGVYVRRMLLSRRERDLLPPWARFVDGVVESPRLRPTVSRESLRQDDMFHHVQTAIADQLLDYLGQMADDEPDRWQELVLGHNDLIKGWALKEPALFAAVANLVHFSTSRGRLSLPEIRDVTGDRLYYFTEESSSNQEKLLYEASGLLVIDASRFAESAFLEEYRRHHPSVRLEQLQPGTGTFFREASGDELAEVLQYYRNRGWSVKPVRFDPVNFPAIVVFPPGHDRVRRVKEDIGEGRLSGPLSELMKDFVDRRLQGRNDLEPVLHVNAASPLVRELESRGPQSVEFGPALDLIAQSARFFAGKTMTAEEGREAFDATMTALSSLVERFGERSP